ncbi:MAG: hypothetical protein JO071_15615 [Deltaproteobacteria bacterium]|nr:hypothetical protein [Deltaproteobacteria bacterium]
MDIRGLTKMGMLRRSVPGVCARYAATNAYRAVSYSFGAISHSSGVLSGDISAYDAVASIDQAFKDYKRYSGLERFYGAVAEIGPGDNCGMGLLFLAEGCERVDLLERFYPARNRPRERLMYARILNVYPNLRRNCTTYPPEDEYSFKCLFPHYGPKASAEQFFKENRGYNFIVSRAVLQSLNDPISAVRDMARALVSHGMLVHKVDLRDWGMFSGEFHELKFLEMPSWLYTCMTRGSGRPNRVLINRYRDILEEERLEHSFFITRLAGVGDIVPHLPYEDISPDLLEKSLAYVRSVRARFAPCFDSASDQDLSVTGFFVVATKP